MTLPQKGEIELKITKFEKNNCTPCKMVDQLFEMHGIEYDEIYNLDTDGLTDEFVEFGVTSVPTIKIEYSDHIEIIYGFDYAQLVAFAEKYGTKK